MSYGPQAFEYLVKVPSFDGWRVVAGFNGESDARWFAHHLAQAYPSVRMIRTSDGEYDTVAIEK